MAQTPFNPTNGVSTHEDCVNIINSNVTDAENRLGSLESTPPAHTHIASDIDSETAPDNYVLTANGASNATWEAGGVGAGALFNVVLVNGATHTQVDTDSHHLYDDSLLVGGGGGSGSGSGGGGGVCMVVDLLPAAQHIGVTYHKKIGDSCEIELVAPVGSTIDGAASYLLTSQYEAISIFTDGTNYFIQ